MSRLFDWTRMDTDFMRHVIMESERTEKYKKKFEDQSDEEVDVLYLARIMKTTFHDPDIRFTRKYRRIIERDLLWKYPEICDKVLRVMRIPRGTRNERIQL